MSLFGYKEQGKRQQNNQQKEEMDRRIRCQEDLAKKSGVKYTTLTKIESNVIKKPSVLIMAKLAKALGVSIEDLIK